MQKVDLIVVLVHGTFASGAKWTREGRLVSALQGLPGVLVSQGDWSGTNTLAGRGEGARRVAETVRSLLECHPAARAVLIGHSHGGNVCLAAAGLISDARVLGVVCLATPFLHVAQRNLGWSPRALSAVARAVGLGFVVLALWVGGRMMNWLMPLVSPALDVFAERWWLMPLGLVVLVCTILAAFLGPFIALAVLGFGFLILREMVRNWIGEGLSAVRRLVPAWVLFLILGMVGLGLLTVGAVLASAVDARFVTGSQGLVGGVAASAPLMLAKWCFLTVALLSPFLVAGVAITLVAFLLGSGINPEQVVNSIQSRVPGTAKLLLIRRACDEVQGALGTAQFASWATSRVWGSISAIADVFIKIGTSARTLRGLLVCVAALVIGSLSHAAGPGPVSDQIAGLAVISVVTYLLLMPLPEIAAVLALVAFFPIAVSISVFLTPFSVDLIWLGPLLEASAESTPEGNWPVYNLGLPSTGFRHAVYDDPTCAEVITAWLSRSIMSEIGEASDGALSTG